MLEKITFKKPDFKKISEDGFFAVDMHLHSEYSDSRTKVKNIIKKAAKKNFGIAIADHNEIKGSLKAMEQEDVLVIPAIEVTVLEGFHVLLYFYSKDEMIGYYERFVKKYKTENPFSRIKKDLNTILNDASDFNCITSLPHPFGYLWTNLKSRTKDKRKMRFFDKVDALEVLNGEIGRVRNLRAVEWAIKLNKAYTAGSDAHMLTEIGSVVTLSRNSTVEGFLNSIRKKRNIVVGKEKKIINRMIYHAPGIDKHLKHTPTNVKYTYKHIYKKKLKEIKGKTKEKLVKIKNNLK